MTPVPENSDAVSVIMLFLTLLFIGYRGLCVNYDD